MKIGNILSSIFKNHDISVMLFLVFHKHSVCGVLKKHALIDDWRQVHVLHPSSQGNDTQYWCTLTPTTHVPAIIRY